MKDMVDLPADPRLDGETAMDDARSSLKLAANVVVVFSLSHGKSAVEKVIMRLGLVRRNTVNLQLIVAILATIGEGSRTCSGAVFFRGVRSDTARRRRYLQPPRDRLCSIS
jgi:hypothetical protein